MHWTPLSGAKFENVFGPAQIARRNPPRTRRRSAQKGRIQPKLESLEQRDVPAVAANLGTTSLADMPAQVTTGDVVHYRVQVEIPAGQIAVNSLALDAILPAGQTFANDGTAKIALVSDGGISSSLAPVGSDLYVAGDATSVNSITPTFALPADAITATPTGVNFASGVTGAASAGQEYIVIEFDAVVGDGAAVTTGSTFASNVQLVVNGAAQGAAVSGQGVAVAPALSDVTKAATQNADGSTTYTLTFNNAADPNGATAYDVRVLDAAPAGQSIESGSLGVVGGTGVSDNSSDGQLDVALSAVAPGGSVTITYTTSAIASVGEQMMSLNSGIQPLGRSANSISGLVFGDVDHSGGFNAGDALLSGVEIDLVDESTGQVVQTTFTGTDGTFSFSGIADGTYDLTEPTQPAGWMDGNDFPGNAGGVADPIPGDDIRGITLQGGVVATGYMFGECPCDTASLTGYVYSDDNYNGIRDPGEPGIAGVAITLTNTDTGVSTTTTTDGAGAYSFVNLAEGNYQVSEDASTLPATIVEPSGSVAQVTNAFRNTAGTVNGVTNGVAVAGQDLITSISLDDMQMSVGNNFGENDIVQKASLCGYVYSDDNYNGIFDPGETGIPGVTVILTNTDTGATRTTTTDANGAYFFNNLPAGTYSVTEDASTLPATVVETDGTIATVTNAFRNMAGTVNGMTRGVAVPGQDVIDEIHLYGGDKSVSNDFGDNDIPLANASLTGFVYSDDNLNGVFDPGETGIPGVTVRLTNTTTNVTVSTTTATNGSYSFTNLAPGTYQVTEDATTLPRTVVETDGTIAIVTNAFRNKAGTVNGVTRGVAVPGQDLITSITLASGDNSVENDFGDNDIQPAAASISGFSYSDVNMDGVRDAGDIGIPNVTIRLDYTGSNPNALPFPLFTTTAADGSFSFRGAALGFNLPLGTYTITEIASTLPTTFIDSAGRLMNITRILDARAGFSSLTGRQLGFGLGLFDIEDINLDENDDSSDDNEFICDCATPVPSKSDLLASSGTSSTLPTSVLAGLASGAIIDGDTSNGVASAQVFATSPSFPVGASAPAGTSSTDANLLVTGADAGGPPLVRVFNVATGAEMDIMAYDPSFAGGVRVALGDVNGDGTPDIITAPGAGGGPHIKVFDGKTGQLITQFMAYAPSFTGGVYVAAGDVNGDGKADIITGAGAGGGPHVKVFDGATGQTIASFMAFAPSFAGGVRVAAGDFNGDGLADIVTAAGPGGGPQVKIFDVSAALTNAAAGLNVLRSFMAYNVNFSGGVYVAAGDVNGDGVADLVTGAGEGGGPHVEVFDGRTFNLIDSFMAFDPSLDLTGARVGLVDANGDGKDDIVIGSGTFVRVVNANNNNSELQFFQAFNPASLSGNFVA